jgi:hypothetical protein
MILGASEDSASTSIASRYNVSHSRALKDHQQLREKLLSLATIPDLDPVMFLGLDRTDPYDRAPSAPYRLDCALTYATDPEGDLDPLAHKRVDRELSTEEWKQILGKAWEAGIPHVTFTGGEPTRRDDLLDLIAYAEELGQVTGLLTEGRCLADEDYTHSLEMTGLDHILIALVPQDQQSQAGLKCALDSDVFTAVHLVASGDNLDPQRTLLREIYAMGVPAVSLSAADDPSSLEVLSTLRDEAADLGMELIWDLPAPYSSQNPIAIEMTDVKSGGGRAWLYVEPDGDVLPEQGRDPVLGNLLREEWADIWGHTTTDV